MMGSRRMGRVGCRVTNSSRVWPSECKVLDWAEERKGTFAFAFARIRICQARLFFVCTFVGLRGSVACV